MNNESDIEKLYRKLAAKFDDNRTWHQLHIQEQLQFIQGVNMIMQTFQR
jgi:archaellum biogenesis protein FlaJ (TadC family)